MIAIRKSECIRSKQAWIGGRGPCRALCWGHSQARLQAPPTGTVILRACESQEWMGLLVYPEPSTRKGPPLCSRWGRPWEALGFDNWPKGTSQSRDHELIRQRHEGLRSPHPEYQICTSPSRASPKQGSNCNFKPQTTAKCPPSPGIRVCMHSFIKLFS